MSNNNNSTLKFTGEEATTRANATNNNGKVASGAESTATHATARGVRTTPAMRRAGVAHRIVPRESVSTEVTTLLDRIVDLPLLRSSGALYSRFKSGVMGFLPFDGEQNGEVVSAIIYTLRSEDVVAAVPLVLASTLSEELGELYIAANKNDPSSQAISMPRVVSDVFNQTDSFYNAIVDTVQAAYPDAEVQVVGQLILQNTIGEIDELKAAQLFFRLNDVAENHLVSIGVMAPEEPFRLGDAATVDGKLSVNVSMGGKDKADPLGVIRREDVKITLQARSKDTRFSMGGTEVTRLIKILNVVGFIDYCYVGLDPAVKRGAILQEGDTCAFAPRFVITGMDVESGGVTLQHTIAAIFMSAILAEQDRWLTAFKPEHSRHDTYRNIGGLGTEIPAIGHSLDENIYVGVENINDISSLVQFAADAIYSNQLAVAMDHEPGGVIGHITEMLLLAGEGDQNAMAAVVAAADDVFNGCFRAEYERRGQPVLIEATGKCIPQGNFTHADGTLRDIRSIDQLFAQHAGIVGDAASDFARCVWDFQADPLFCASEQLRMMRGIVENVNLQGWNTRILFTNEFFDICSAAAAAARIDTIPDSNFVTDFVRTSRGVRNQLGIGGINGGTVFRNQALQRTNRHNRVFTRRGQ